MIRPPGHLRLMVAARDANDLATLAFAGVLSRFRILGLEAPVLRRLCGRYFPGAPLEDADPKNSAASGEVDAALATEEFDDLLRLLRDHRRDDLEETEWLAHVVVSACAGKNHLWEDMALPDRESLSQLIKRYFPILYFKNTGNLRWKKFFYQQLCDRAEVRICKAPSCGVCTDYVQCFGPE